MSTQVQFRRGTAAENNAFTGALAEVTVNTTDNTLRVHDGVTVGGATMVGLTATQTLTNKTLTSAVLTTPNIGVATGTSLSATGAINTATTVSATGNITGGNIVTGGTISSTGNITTSGFFVGSFSSGTNLTLGNVTLGNIINVNSAGVGNIGNSTGGFNTVFAKATSAQYADVAELYTADAEYAPGTVLIFGGTQEVTAQIQSHSTAIAGVVSENPSHLMNAGLQSEYSTAVALLGRVRCQVQGTIRKGDLLVASDTVGTAQRLDLAQYQPGCIIGKSLENYNSATVGMIEIAVGVK